MILKSKITIFVLIFVLSAFGLLAAGFYDLEVNAETFTGSFSDGHQSEQVYVEDVYWEFGENQTARGSIVEQNFSEGKHNITLVVEKSNGEIERHYGELEFHK